MGDNEMKIFYRPSILFRHPGNAKRYPGSGPETERTAEWVPDRARCVRLSGMTLIVLLSLFTPAFAQNVAQDLGPPKTEEGAPAKPPVEPEQTAGTDYIYNEDGCDFVLTLPSRPYATQRCPEVNKCYSLLTYTTLYESGANLNVNFTCNPSKPLNFTNYNEEAMRLTLDGMAKSKGMTQYVIDYRDLEVARTASLGANKSRDVAQGGIYAAQIWSGQKSILTLEAELVGPGNPEASAALRKILGTVKLKAPEAPAVEAQVKP